MDEIIEIIASETIVPVLSNESGILEVFEPDQLILEAKPASASSSSQFTFSFDELTAGDVMVYSGATWTNRPQENLTDGGNF